MKLLLLFAKLQRPRLLNIEYLLRKLVQHNSIRSETLLTNAGLENIIVRENPCN